jgi:hypothetical protein
MWLSAEERHKHRQALCKRLLHNCNPCEECNIRVVRIVHIRQHMPDAKQWKPDAGAASVIYNATRRKNKPHGIIAASRVVCNATRRFGDGSCLIVRQRVRGSAGAVRAVWNTRVFQTATRVVADVCPVRFRCRLKSLRWKANGGSPRCAWKLSIWSKGGRGRPTDWNVSRQCLRHSRCAWR